MPPYMTLSFGFAKDAKHELVRRFYEHFGAEDISFLGVLAWGCSPDLSMEQIIVWNQQKLNEDFELGYDEHVSNDYRQVLYSVPPFSECRVFIMNNNEEIRFYCIVPESEIDQSNCTSLLTAADRVWANLPVRVIDSYGESDDGVGIKELERGIAPTASLFAYVDELPAELTEQFEVYKLNRGYRLRAKEA